MKEHARAWRGVPQILHHSVEVESFGLLVEIPVLAHIHAACCKDLIVVSPCWVADVNWSWSVLLQKLRDDPQSSRSTQSLRRCNSSACDIGMIPSEKNTSGSFVVGLITVNRAVFLVKIVIVGDQLFAVTDHGEHEWLAIL